MNPNIYDLLAMQNQAPQLGGAMPGLMVQGIPQVAGVSQPQMENPNAQAAPKRAIAAKLGITPDTGSASALSAPPDASASLMDLFRKKAQAANDAQQASITGIENQANALRNAPKQTDYSALLGLVDSWTGSNLSKAYQKPASEQERAQQLLGLQSQLLGAKDKISDNELNMLKTQLGDQRDQQRMKHETELEKYKWAALTNSNDKKAGQMSIDDEKQISKFSDKINNPSSKSYLNGLQRKIDAADSVLTLTNAFTGGLPANASRQEKIAAYDNLTVTQAEEVTKNLDNLISGGSPTISGADHLRFETVKSKLSEMKAKLGNQPVPAHLGAFIEQALDTVDREKKNYTNKKSIAHQGMKAGIPGLVSRHGATIDDILERGGRDSGPTEGNQMSADDKAAFDYVQSHPNDPDAIEIKKLHGWK